MLDIKKVKDFVNSDSLEEVVKGIEYSIEGVNEISLILLQVLTENTNRFVVTEKISQYFSDYLSGLKMLLNSSNPDVKFWAATLIMHYNINNIEAESILLEEVKKGPLDNAYTATTILYRIKNANITSAVRERLKDNTLDEKAISFFKEKLSW